MKKTMKMKVCDFIYTFRHCLAFLTILCFILFYGIASYAWSSVTLYYTAFGNPTTFDVYYSTSGSVAPLIYSNMKNAYTGSDIIPNNFANTASGASFAQTWSNVQANIPVYSTLTAQNTSYENLNFDLSTAKHVFYDFTYYGDPTNNTGVFYIYQDTQGDIAFVNDYLVSTVPFYIFQAENGQPYGNIWYQDVASSRGFYECAITDFMYLTSYAFMNTDIPIYLSSTSGGTGFTSLSDFSFSGNNINFNTSITDGSMVDPNAPEPEVESDAKYNLTFRDATYYTGSGLNRFWHNNNFTFTEYQINNPTYYRLRFSYRVDFSNNLGLDSQYFYTPTSDIQLAYFLGQSNRLGTGSRIGVPLSSDWFVNSNGQTLTNAIISTINTVTGENVNYINPNGLFENIIEWVTGDHNYFWGSDSGSNLQSVTPRYDGVITKFKIYGEVSLYNEVNSNYESGSYIDSHDFLTGQGKVESTDNTIPPYEESPVPVYTQLPTDGSGGVSTGSGSAVAIIEKGANQITVYGGSNQGGFMMPSQDWSAFGGLLQEMKTGLTTVSTDNGVMSAMQVVQNVTSGVLPTSGNATTNKLWILIYAGVAGSVVIALWNKAAHNH